MILTEYDAERHIANEKKLSHEEGIREGIKEGKKEGIREGTSQGIAILLDTLKELNYTREKAKEKLIEKYHLSITESETYMKKYWQEN